MKIRLKDSVIVLTGKDRGQTGVVSKISQKNNTVTLEGLNTRIKHVKARNGVAGDRVEFAAPIHVSNVALVDPKSGKPTRVRYEKQGKDKVRISVRSGEPISAGIAPKKEAKKEVKTTSKTTSSKTKK